jgi:thiazole synthase ThiGH ThiG subunit
MPSPDPIGAPNGKLEVLGEAKTLYPDMYETLRATEVLAKEGFKPMVYWCRPRHRPAPAPSRLRRSGES